MLTALAADGHHLQGKHLFGPFCRLLSPRPLHELFAEAWAKSPSRQGG
ncbi:hypothetical protein [Streptomyces sp. NBC_00878]|nr:hypothetical protein [Streptomyces sp. NBC_00878]MCX4908940.1 hypothetical protein [Streptomyces sp. NBC_00878]